MMKAVFGPAAAAKRSQGKTESGVEIEPPKPPPVSRGQISLAAAEAAGGGRS